MRVVVDGLGVPHLLENAMRIRCPVCWRGVHTSVAGLVWKHRDKAGHTCPMGGKPAPTHDEYEGEGDGIAVDSA